MEEMITLVRQADLLRTDAALHKSIELIGRTIGFKPGWLESSAFVPSPTTVRTYRFKLDMALTLQMRKHFASLGPDLLICLLADSSPRAGREWLFSELFIISKRGARIFRKARTELLRMRASGTWSEERAK